MPILGICYGFQLMVSGLGGAVARPGSASTARRGSTCSRRRVPPRRCSPGCQPAAGVDVARGHLRRAAPPGFTVTAGTAVSPVAAMEDRRPRAVRRAVPPRGDAHRARHGDAAPVPGGRRAAAGTGPCAASSTSRWRRIRGAGRRRAGHLRPVRRGGLGGRRGPGTPGHRHQAHLRIRRSRAAAPGRGRAGGAGFRRRDRGGPARRGRRRGRSWPRWRGWPTRRRSARSSAGSSSARSSGPPRQITARAGAHGEAVEFLVQGTLYPDVVESGGGSGAASIKSHHNVGGLPERPGFKLVEPLRDLFKDEVRRVGAELGLPPAIVGGQPFPGPGLAIRIVGEVTAGAAADPARGGRDRPRGAVGGRAGPADLAVPGGAARRRVLGRRPGRRAQLRLPRRAPPGDQRGRHDRRLGAAARGVLGRISTRITNEVPEINRVVLDVTSKPPGTIEWE